MTRSACLEEDGSLFPIAGLKRDPEGERVENENKMLAEVPLEGSVGLQQWLPGTCAAPLPREDKGWWRGGRGGWGGVFPVSLSSCNIERGREAL